MKKYNYLKAHFYFGLGLGYWKQDYKDVIQASESFELLEVHNFLIPFVRFTWNKFKINLETLKNE